MISSLSFVKSLVLKYLMLWCLKEEKYHMLFVYLGDCSIRKGLCKKIDISRNWFEFWVEIGVKILWRIASLIGIILSSWNRLRDRELRSVSRINLAPRFCASSSCSKHSLLQFSQTGPRAIVHYGLDDTVV